jgi:PAS domain S-box-containing protein
LTVLSGYGTLQNDGKTFCVVLPVVPSQAGILDSIVMRPLTRALDQHLLRRYPSRRPDERDRIRNFVFLCSGLIAIFAGLGALSFGRQDLHPPYYFGVMVAALSAAIVTVLAGRHLIGFYLLLALGGPFTQMLYLGRAIADPSHSNVLLQGLLLVSIGNMLLNGYYAQRKGHLHGLNALSVIPAVAGVVVVTVGNGLDWALHYVSLLSIVLVCLGLSYAWFQTLSRSAGLDEQDNRRREQLETTTRNMEAILENSGEAFLLLDREGRVVTFNSVAAQKLPKVGVGPLRKGAVLTEIVGEQFRAETVERLAAALRGESGAADMHLIKWGEDRWVNVKYRSVRAADGSSAGMCITVSDITDRKILESRLLASADQKETLLREVHHRVKNNFQLILSLMSLQSDRFADSEAEAVIAETRNRIRAMSAVHESLYRSSDLRNIDMEQFVPRFVGQLLNAYQSAGCRVEMHVEPVNLLIERAVPCSLILNELVTNALKYAFVDGREGVISIGLAHQNGAGSAQRVLMSVVDNGVGIPAAVRVEDTGSLGMKLIRALAGQLGGTVHVSTGCEQVGTRVEVDFPA